MCRACTLSALVIVAALTGPAAAVTPQSADAVVKVAATRPAAEHKFERWVNDVLLFTAHECWSQRVPAAPAPAILTRAESVGASFNAPAAAEVESLCAELARSGAHPVCFDARVFAATPVFDTMLPPQYVQFERLTSAPVVTAVLTCRLTARDVPGSHQEYTDVTTARWTMPPRVTSVPTARGARSLRVGMLQVLVPRAGEGGEPFRAFVPAVIQP